VRRGDHNSLLEGEETKVVMNANIRLKLTFRSINCYRHKKTTGNEWCGIHVGGLRSGQGIGREARQTESLTDGALTRRLEFLSSNPETTAGRGPGDREVFS